MTHLIFDVFCVWCGKCAKNLAFGTFTTPAVDALIMIMVFEVKVIIMITAFEVQINDEMEV